MIRSKCKFDDELKYKSSCAENVLSTCHKFSQYELLHNSNTFIKSANLEMLEIWKLKKRYFDSNLNNEIFTQIIETYIISINIKISKL